ncbi:MAG: glycosyltransferase family 9 protein [Deltaproteobacteria bacterium]|nr:glycosyltransferase family 9 protein [Deltaproteobacteria bacterium]
MISPGRAKRILFSRQGGARILVVRNDGLGDLILTLPLVTLLKARFPQARVDLLVHAPLAPVARLLEGVDEVLEDPGVLLKRHANAHPPAQAAALRQTLLGNITLRQYDAAVLAYPEAGSARLIHQAGIPIRVGSLRRSFFWRFNAWSVQSRKGSAFSEMELNLALARPLGLPPEYFPPRLNSPPPPPWAAGGGWVVMHPYKRNATALSWPLENFSALAQRLTAAGLSVAAVGDAADRPVLEQAFGGLSGVRVETGLDLPGLAGLISSARLFVGNSSGPLHLAGWAGIPHLGFFPQNRVSAPARWRPLPPAPGRPQPPPGGQHLLASRFPKACVRCQGPACPYFNCVASISLGQAMEAIKAWGVV